MSKNSRILIGKVSGCFGVNGWLKIFSYCDPREHITTYKTWIVEDKKIESVESRKHSKLIIAKFDGIDDKETAETFIGKKIEIEQTDLKRLNKNQYYWHDLIGLTVTNTQGIEFGSIKSMLETGANDVVIVKGAERERLIPYITQETEDKTIIEVNLDNKTMVVDWHEDD